MFTKLTTALSAAALSLSLATTPAIADSKKTENFIAAAALVTLLGLAAHESNKKKQEQLKKKQEQAKKKREQERRRQASNRNQRRSLPLSCLQTFRVQGGKETAFNETCLERNFKFEKQMPNQCRETLWTDKGTRRVYQPRCLRRYGYEARNYY
ncbi:MULTISPECIES: hypothetical protein [Halocynthiibacter]|uniref:Uncharacterized protein n=1 Tax=Halocynthiibacter halioticoli TaxID=2986804 RepID=A0AAE3J1K5_9RHOB|nr:MULTISPECIES: hypothetical protein [Halocynthiibacter]MCV6825679.1 hypothetical protein [Halocynthiibacter halioticoli]MCW4058680.1 hypothetical protein [Halocynthiibacter sp. SDUM655004]